jgi:Tol biopolymer transport system component
MDLRPGSRLGPYEILGSIGAGGMGEVYRARDPRLDRQVAVKVLPGAVSGDAERLRRFEREAKAAGALNHPNVLAVYDAGTHDGTPYVVSELLEGETFRSRMGGTALPVRKALDYAAQTARGLAAAHEKGIVHRDLKPENLFVTKDGRVKILDFGLAKLAGTEAPGAQPPQNAAVSELETDTGTIPGTLMGTVGYMSPEQVQGLAADHRSDIFSFGAVFYEMLTGRRAFKAPTAAETLTAILKQDPLQTSEPGSSLAPGLERVLRHCLEKSPEERFQSARDLAFALDALSVLSDGGPSAARRRSPLGRLGRLALPLLGLGVAVGLGIVAGRGVWEIPPPSFRQLTFRSGAVPSARFSPLDQTIVFSAAWDGAPLELFTTRPEGLEARSLGIQRSQILSVSRQGELAILMLRKDSGFGLDPYVFAPEGGTLARVPLSGGAPREVLEDTLDADWSPDGSELAVSRWVEGKCRLEYPIGKVLYESEAGIRKLRVSPSGDAVAFLEPADVTAGVVSTTRVAVVDRAGVTKTLSSLWGISGMAWSPSGQEVWFDSPDKGGATSLRGVTLAGKSRLITRFAGLATLLDVGGGRALVIDDNGRNMIFARAPGENRERNLSWHNDSTVADLSRDGRVVLFNETIYGGGPNFGIYLRRTDGSPAVRLGDGFGFGLSPDGQWVLAFTSRGRRLELVLLPTRAGEPRRIAEGLPAAFHGAAWLPNSRGFVFSGSSRGEGARLYLQDIDGGPPRPITEAAADLRAPVLSPDGRTLAALDADGTIALRPVDGGEIRTLTGVEEGELPIQWSEDGKSLYVYPPQRMPIEIFQVTLAGGRRLLKEIVLDDTTGLEGRFVVTMTPDARAYAYSFYRHSHELYLVEGLK